MDWYLCFQSIVQFLLVENRGEATFSLQYCNKRNYLFSHEAIFENGIYCWLWIVTIIIIIVVRITAIISRCISFISLNGLQECQKYAYYSMQNTFNLRMTFHLRFIFVVEKVCVSTWRTCIQQENNLRANCTKSQRE